MALVKRLEKLQPISAAEYDAVVTQVEDNQSKLDGFDTSEIIFSVADETAMTAKYNSEVAAGRTPIDGKEQVFRKDLNQFWKWNSSLTVKAEFSRENQVANTTEKPTLTSENLIVSGKIKEGIDDAVNAFDDKLHLKYKLEKLTASLVYNYAVIQEDGDVYTLNGDWTVQFYDVSALEKVAIKSEIVATDAVRGYAFYTGSVERDNSTGSSKYISGASFTSGSRVINEDDVTVPQGAEVLAVVSSKDLNAEVVVNDVIQRVISETSKDLIRGDVIYAYIKERTYEVKIQEAYVLTQGKTDLTDFEVGDKFRAWLGDRYVVGKIIALLTDTLANSINDTTKIKLVTDSEI